MMEKNTEADNHTTQQDKPPIFSSWRNMYFLVFVQLLVLIALLYLFTRYFS